MPLSVLHLGVKVLLRLLAALFHTLLGNSPFSEEEDNILEVDAKLTIPLCLSERLFYCC